MPPKTRSSQGEILPATDLTGRRGYGGSTRSNRKSVANSLTSTSETNNELLMTDSSALREIHRQSGGSFECAPQQLQVVPRSLEKEGFGDARSRTSGGLDKFQVTAESHRSQEGGANSHQQLGRAFVLEGAPEEEAGVSGPYSKLISGVNPDKLGFNTDLSSHTIIAGTGPTQGHRGSQIQEETFGSAASSQHQYQQFNSHPASFKEGQGRQQSTQEGEQEQAAEEQQVQQTVPDFRHSSGGIEGFGGQGQSSDQEREQSRRINEISDLNKEILCNFAMNFESIFENKLNSFVNDLSETMNKEINFALKDTLENNLKDYDPTLRNLNEKCDKLLLRDVTVMESLKLLQNEVKPPFNQESLSSRIASILSLLQTNKTDLSIVKGSLIKKNDLEKIGEDLCDLLKEKITQIQNPATNISLTDINAKLEALTLEDKTSGNEWRDEVLLSMDTLMKKIDNIHSESALNKSMLQVVADKPAVDLTGLAAQITDLQRTVGIMSREIVDLKQMKILQSTPKSGIPSGDDIRPDIHETPPGLRDSLIRGSSQLAPSIPLKYESVSEDKVGMRESVPHTQAPVEDWQLQKIILQSLPHMRDWKKFSGRSDENFFDFIDFVDGIILDINPPDTIITTKLGSLLTGIAGEWYRQKRKESGKQPWLYWRNAIIDHFGNSVWQNKMQLAFDENKFDIRTKDPSEWVTKQARVLEAISPDLSKLQRNRKIIFLCNPDIQWNVKLALQKDNWELSELINVLNTMKGNADMKQKYNWTASGFSSRRDDRVVSTRDGKPDTGKQQSEKPKVIGSSEIKRSCRICGDKNHLSYDCPKKPKSGNINAISSDQPEMESEPESSVDNNESEDNHVPEEDEDDSY